MVAVFRYLFWVTVVWYRISQLNGTWHSPAPGWFQIVTGILKIQIFCLTYLQKGTCHSPAPGWSQIITGTLSHLSAEGYLSQPSSRVISNNYRYFVSPLGWRVLVTSQLQGDLKVVGGQVVEVLHPTRYWVPDTKSQAELQIQVDLVTVGMFQQARFYYNMCNNFLVKMVTAVMPVKSVDHSFYNDIRNLTLNVFTESGLYFPLQDPCIQR